MLVTSRLEEDIQSVFSSASLEDCIIPIQGNLVNSDIGLYVRSRVRESDGLKRWRQRPEVQEEIESTLLQKANGMFRWAACQVDVLENCLDYPQLSKALNSLPKTLDETYSRILQAIPEEHKPTAIRILQFLIFTEQPLTIAELVDMIAVTDDEPYFDAKHRMPEPNEILRYCSSLVVTLSVQYVSRVGFHRVKKTKIELHLAHFTVKEYLTSQRLGNNMIHYFQEAKAHERIASICIAYLLHFKEYLLWSTIEQDFPFAQYSSQFWMFQARACGGEGSGLHNLVDQLFCHNDFSYKIYCEVLNYLKKTSRRREMRDLGRTASPLHYAVMGKWETGVRFLLEKGVDVDHQTVFGTPLFTALQLDHSEIVKLLLGHGCNVNAMSRAWGSALQLASGKGNEEVVELLLVNGADPNLRDTRYRTSLHRASNLGSKQTVKLLVKHEADVDALDTRAGTALQTASLKGHKQVVEILLACGAKVNAKGGTFCTALQAAAWSGHEAIVKLLFDHNGDANLHGGEYGSPLQAASLRGHSNVVKFLLDKGADPNAQRGRYNTALQAAAFYGHEQIVQLLLDHGVNVNAQGGFFNSALQAAARKGRENVVRLLVDRGADVNIRGKYQSALKAAREGGYKHMQALLVEHGAREAD